MRECRLAFHKLPLSQSSLLFLVSFVPDVTIASSHLFFAITLAVAIFLQSAI